MTNLGSILKNRDIIFSTKVCLVKVMVFPVVMYGCKSWTRLSDELHCTEVGHSFPSKEQESFNFMTAVTICSDFGAPQNKV